MCSRQRVLIDKAQCMDRVWMNHSERKMKAVFEAKHALRSALNSWIRKLRQPIEMADIGRPMADAIDSLQTKS